MKKDWILGLSDGEKLNITTFGINSRSKIPTIIYVHGFKGFKDWGFVPYLAEFLSSQGIFVITFNFSHNGIGSNMTEFTELEKFAANTLSREVRELSELIEAYRDGFFGQAESSLGLLGHSRGGGVSLVTARLKDDIRAVVTWSAVATFSRYTPEIEGKWQKDGYFEILNQRTGQIMRLGLGLLQDIKNNSDDFLSIEKAVKRSRQPLLIIHGEEDEAVPVKEARQMADWSGSCNSELVIIPGTGHTFGAKHPFEGSNSALDEVLARSCDFFKKEL
jgi:dipeptidyl aminopeptidase/acylaminoacyl peptidase